MSEAGLAELGVFLPIGNGGWIVSTSSPRLEASYADNRDIAVLAERHGLDFVMSMAKWRGYGGPSDHWGRTLESMTMMAGIAEATERVGIWATVHTPLFHPALVAKVFATLDQISGGRAGMNIVVGSYAREFSQMGLWSGLDHDARYRHAEEWVTALKRLWTEDSVTTDGEFFQLQDCQSRPHPAAAPTLVCAGRSPAGLAFQARHCDAAFLSGHDLASLRAVSDQVRGLAEAEGRRLRTYAMLTVVLGETDADARRRHRAYSAGVDAAALRTMTDAYGLSADRSDSMAARAVEQGGFLTEVVVGSPQTVVEQVAQVVEGGALDGVMLVFPDYLRDLPAFAEAVLPLLRPDRTPGAAR